MSCRSNPLLQSELADWCREAWINPAHALLLTVVPKNTEIARIEEVAESVKVFGRVRIRDTKCGATPTTLLVLCECREAVDPTCCPMELRPTDAEETWMILMAVKRDSTTAAPAGFADKLTKFLRDEGKSMTDLQALFPPLSSNPGSPESIICAVGEIGNAFVERKDTHTHTLSATTNSLGLKKFSSLSASHKIDRRTAPHPTGWPISCHAIGLSSSGYHLSGYQTSKTRRSFEGNICLWSSDKRHGSPDR